MAHIITETGEVVEGTVLSDEELAVREELDRSLKNVGSSYLSASECKDVKAYLFRTFNMTLRVSHGPTPNVVS